MALTGGGGDMRWAPIESGGDERWALIGRVGDVRWALVGGGDESHPFNSVSKLNKYISQSGN